jgi:hypothetical protein
MSTDRSHHGRDKNQKPKTKNKKMNIYKDGEKVKGQYYGVKFTGVVNYGRPHTMNDSYLHFIDLDTPIIVFGAERDGIVLTTGGENTIEANFA